MSIDEAGGRDSAPPGEAAVGPDPESAARKQFLSARALRILRVAFSVAVVAALGVVCYHAISGVSSLSFDIRPAWLIGAWPLALASFPLLAVAWSQMLAAYGHQVPVPVVVRLWSLAQASRYLPTGLAAVASRAVLAARHGVPRALSVTTMAAEGALLAAWCALGAGALLAAGGHQPVIPVAIGGLAGIVAVPVALHLAGRARWGQAPRSRLARFVVRFTRSEQPPRSQPLAKAVLTIGLSLIVKTVVFVLYARALLPVHLSDLALLVGATNLAAVAGLVGVTPAGIGVREGVLVALLEHRFGAANATAMALTLRVWDLTVELPWVIGSVLVSRRRPV
ncbi:MAG TPA: lysylphosphatidylglycerol synthase domain-containing protein [Acidimicrobiales bacterium]|nr:lysylphosphatidylglycerol synthase domain-containing protein [Acidimicrobiales bacterium]